MQQSTQVTGGEEVRLDARPLAIVDAMRVRLPVAMDARDQA